MTSERRFFYGTELERVRLQAERRQVRFQRKGVKNMRKEDFQEREENPIQQFAAVIQNAERRINEASYEGEIEAAWLMDGLGHAMLGHWYAMQDRELPSVENLRSDLGSLNDNAKWRLQMFLTTSNVDAKVIHSKNLFHVLFGDKG